MTFDTDKALKQIYRQRVECVIPERFIGGFESFPLETDLKMTALVTRAMEWADKFKPPNEPDDLASKKRIPLDATEKGVYLGGRLGNRKTGLAYAILRQAGLCGVRIAATNVGELFSRYHDSWSKKEETEGDIRREYTEGIDLLLLDDLGAEMQNDRASYYLYELIDQIYRKLRPVIIVTSNLAGESLEEYYNRPNGERALSRLSEMTEVWEMPQFNLREGA